MYKHLVLTFPSVYFYINEHILITYSLYTNLSQPWHFLVYFVWTVLVVCFALKILSWMCLYPSWIALNCPLFLYLYILWTSLCMVWVWKHHKNRFDRLPLQRSFQ